MISRRFTFCWTIERRLIRDHSRTLSTVFASVVELLYDYNLKSPHVSIHEILSRRLQALGRLEHWRRNLTLRCTIPSASPTSPPSTEDELGRFQILISIHYYRALLLLNRPVIILVLSHCSKDLEDQSEYELLNESLLPIVKTDFLAAQSLCEIIRGICGPQHSFLDLNAAWFISNYSSRPCYLAGIVSNS